MYAMAADNCHYENQLILTKGVRKIAITLVGKTYQKKVQYWNREQTQWRP